MFLYNVNRGVIKLVITNLHRLLKALLSGRDFFHLPSIPSHRFLDKNMLVCLDRIENCIMVGPAVANEYRLDVLLRQKIAVVCMTTSNAEMVADGIEDIVGNVRYGNEAETVAILEKVPDMAQL
jgi:hypothetical protein